MSLRGEEELDMGVDWDWGRPVVRPSKKSDCSAILEATIPLPLPLHSIIPSYSYLDRLMTRIRINKKEGTAWQRPALDQTSKL